MSTVITSTAELLAVRDRARDDLALRGEPKDTRVTVHMGTCGIAAGAREVLGYLIDELGEEAASKVTLCQSGCAGLCGLEPMLTVTDAAGHTYRYGRLDRRKVRDIVASHIREGRPVTRLLVEG